MNDPQHGVRFRNSLAVEAELDITFAPGLTFELYARLFISSGDYGAIRELAAPRTFDSRNHGEDFETNEREEGGPRRTKPTGNPGHCFISIDRDSFLFLTDITVFRWEWRPGGTLMAKATYWLNP